MCKTKRKIKKKLKQIENVLEQWKRNHCERLILEKVKMTQKKKSQH